MTSVSAGEVGKLVVELLGIREGDPFKIAKTRDGRLILARKPEQ